jgi:bis(5'-nucleosidyl)-tetraphosphatase
MVEIFTCDKGCCSIKIHSYKSPKDPLEKVRRRRKKAGVFIYDPTSNKVLLVQSRGHWWGSPKGSMEYGETEVECAVREVKEETGLEISSNIFTRVTSIMNRSVYFYAELPTGDVNVQTHIQDNDANGICWINMDCLFQCIRNGNISLSQHCRLIFARFKGKAFPRSDFTLVSRKRRNKEV